jgi:hypothetical protein
VKVALSSRIASRLGVERRWTTLLRYFKVLFLYSTR